MPIRPEMKDCYPPDWREISARIRFGRARYLCECRGECGRDHSGDDPTIALAGFRAGDNAHPEPGRCTAVHGLPNPRTGSTVILTVAHLNHTPEDCADDNLRAFCNGCHLAYDKDHHAETRRRSREAQLGLLRLEGM
jgi:hypothetical protein